MALPGSSDPQVQWVESTKRVNSSLLEQLREAKAKEKGTLNFSAYRKAHDHQYLGIMGPSFLGRGYGNDSSNIDAVLHGKEYWKRVYYRPRVEDYFPESPEDAAERERQEEKDKRKRERAAMREQKRVERANRKRGDGRSESATDLASAAKDEPKAPRDLPRVQSEPSIGAHTRTSKALEDGGYAAVRAHMRDMVRSDHKPHLKPRERGEPLKFHNVLDDKYTFQLERWPGANDKTFDYDKGGHRSSKHELTYILSNYYRTDGPMLLDRSTVEK
jgi:hypothetical protein